MQIPSQHRLRTGRIYNVAEAQMWWQASGKRLAVYTKRYSKKTTKAETGEVKYIVSPFINSECIITFREDALTIWKFSKWTGKMFLL